MDMKEYWKVYDEYTDKFGEFSSYEVKYSMEERYSIMKNCLKHNKKFELKTNDPDEVLY